MSSPQAAAAVVALAVLMGVATTDSSAADGPVHSTVPGVRIPVRLSERLTSQEATPGQHFGFETTIEAIVNGVDIPSGSPGDGIVVVAQSGRGRNPGKLQVAAIDVRPHGGKPIAVGLAPNQARTKDASDAPHARTLTVPTVVGTLVFGDITRDTNVVYEEGMRFIVIAPPPPTVLPQPSAAPSL